MERMRDRKSELRAWAAWNDKAYEAYGTDEGIAARRKANVLADALGDFSEADWGVIRNAQRQYAQEAGNA